MANAAVALLDDSQSEKQPKVSKVIKRDLQPKNEPSAAANEHIKIVGIGGGGNNALDHIIRSGAAGVEFLAVNTDAHCLDKCLSVEKLVIGEKLTKGHGAGAMPEVGEQAAIESKEAIRDCLKGCDMVYLAAGMGGGTGTGATPVIAQLAKEMGILTVAVVTRPFNFEGRMRERFANAGIEKLKNCVDALIVVPNERLLALSERTTSFKDAFEMTDNVLRQAVQGVTDLVTKPGFINVDFADLRSVMKHAGGAIMGIGVGSGEFRANDALKKAMESPLMENSIDGAKGVILNVTAHPNVGIQEVQAASEKLQQLIDPEANYIWGLVYDETMGDDIQMVVIATGFEMSSVSPDASSSTSAAQKKTVPPYRTMPQPPAQQQAPSSEQTQQQSSVYRLGRRTTEFVETSSIGMSEEKAFSTIDSPLDTPTYLRRRNLKK